MGKNKSHKKAGSDTQSSDIKIASKALFKILQCVHHLANIGNPQEGIKAKAFLKKEKELNNFVRPAQDHPNSDFRGCFQELTHNYILHILASLRNHYWSRQEILTIEIQNLGISFSDLQIAKQIALKWGRKNFRSKLRTDTISKFTETVQSCILTKKHDTTFDQNSQPHSDVSQPPAQEDECTTKNPLPLPPDGSNPTSASPSGSTSNTSTCNTANLHHTTTPSTPQINTNTSTNSLTKPLPIPASSSVTLHTNKPHITTPPKPKPQPTTTANLQTNHTTPNHPTILNTLTTPAPHLSPQPTTSSHLTLPSTPNTPLLNPPPITSPSNTSHPLWDPKYDPINVQGPKNPLSNFYPCTFEFNEFTYRDTETAYHDQKAVSMGRKDISIELRSTVDAYKSKEISKQLKFDPHFNIWNKQKIETMKTILAEKAVKVPIFKKTLIESYPRRITHNVPDVEWGTSHLRNGRKFMGRDLFARLLMELRLRLLQETGYFGKSSSSHKPKPASTKPVSPTTPFSTTPKPSYNKFSPLTPLDSDFPPLPTPTSPLPTPPTRPTRSTTINITRHNSKKSHPADWQTPNCTSKVVVIGDSNLSRITTKPKKVNSIEVHSFPGAKTYDFHSKICSPSSNPQETPCHVVISVGINDRQTSHQTQTHLNNIKKAVNMAKKTFPQAEIYIPQVNYSPQLSAKEKQSLDTFNDYLEKYAGDSKLFTLIPKLNSKLFNIQTDGIHWTNTTANHMLKHWSHHLHLN